MSWQCPNCFATVQDGMIHGCMDVSLTMSQNNYTLPVVVNPAVPQSATAASANVADVTVDAGQVATATADTVAISPPPVGVNE